MEIPNSDLTPDDIKPGADLQEADLSEANLFCANISGVILNRGTQAELKPADAKRIFSSGDDSQERDLQMWDGIARMYHGLKVAYSENGLVGRARTYRVRERWARRREAKAEGGPKGYSAWFGSLISRVVTGYGVQLYPVVLVMLAIYLVSAAIYWGPDMGIGASLYYSIVTFTTAPPSSPPGGLFVEATAMVETFVGTLLIVLLGYVLGNREQV